LQDRGYLVRAATDGREALEMVLDEKADSRPQARGDP
jgi:CheY-like chemotaxis protein